MVLTSKEDQQEALFSFSWVYVVTETEVEKPEVVALKGVW